VVNLLDKNTTKEAIQHLRKVDKDFLNILDKDKNVVQTFKKKEGFIGLISLITEQQLSVASAKAIFGRLEKKVIPFSAENFFNTKEKNLRACGLSNQKINYCMGIAKAVKQNKLSFKKLESMEDEEVIKKLTSFKGIGEWTANCYLLACMSRIDAWPANDLGIQVAIQKMKKLKTRPNKLTTEKIAEPWRPYRSVAALLLWTTYD